MNSLVSSKLYKENIISLMVIIQSKFLKKNVYWFFVGGRGLNSQTLHIFIHCLYQLS